ncbi:fimbria/pilus periplasmic chaperone [Morganella morganii]|uniref:fimbria/pilus periplasmic chaperone n=1 Tax=Morganella morganii TaxID=582 RepID=UPI0032D9B5C9
MNNRLSSFLFSLILVSSFVHAGGVTVGGTRIIYNGEKKEASLNITSTDINPYLIQSWVEPTQDSSQKSPFIITPPLFRIENNEQNVLRVVRTGGNLPEDRESLYWINVKAIPAGNKGDGNNSLQIAINTRIKLIYRPEMLTDSPENMAKNLMWNQSGNLLTVTNPTPYIMNFQSVNVGEYKIKDATYVMPMSEATFTVPDGISGVISWRIINDYGGIGEVHLSGNH